MGDKGIDIPEKQLQLMDALADELTKISINITPGTIMAFSASLAQRVVDEGWQWHPPKGEEPLAEWEKELLDGGPWKDLPTLNYPEYEINSDGRIRHRETKEDVQPEWDEQWNRSCVTLSKPNMDWLKIDGPSVAKDLFR